MSGDGFDDVAAAFDAVAGDGAHEAPPPEDASERDRLARAAALPLNDYGNGQRVVIHFGRDMMFVPRVGWHVWDGTRWAKDDDLMRVRRWAQALAPMILKEVHFLPRTPAIEAALKALERARDRLRGLEASPGDLDAEAHAAALTAAERAVRTQEGRLAGYRKSQDRVRTHAKNAGNNGPLKHMLEEAEPTLAVPLDRLDAAPFEVNCRSGLLRFRRTDLRAEGAGVVADVDLFAHERAQLQTKCLAAEYDPHAACPAFDAFLEEVQPDPEVRAFLQRWFGLSMTAASVQRIAFFHGSGANGKSVMVDLMAKMLGDYAATVRIESLTGTNRRGGGDATPDLIPLIGARFARTSEPDQGTRLQEGLIKELTGGEPIMVRALHSDFVEVRPIFKLTMSGNHKPEIRGDDEGIWRRVMMVPWEVTIPEERRIPLPDFIDRLYAERAGILNWLIGGLIDYLEGGLAPPAVVRDATSAYRAESDPLGRFLADCTICDGVETETVTTAELKAGFDHWLRENAMPVWQGRTFALSMAKKADTWKHPVTGWTFTKGPSSKQAHYRGIRFDAEFRDRLEAAPRGGRMSAPDPDEGF